VAIVWVATLAAVGITGHHPVWHLEGRNLSEAAALRDGGDIVRRIERGENVNQAHEVRARLVLDKTAILTPIEAAAARDEAITQLLFDLGASPDAAVWHRAFCISDADSVRDILRSHRPPDAVEDCAGQ
jgi:hypothetical protein